MGSATGQLWAQGLEGTAEIVRGGWDLEEVTARPGGIRLVLESWLRLRQRAKKIRSSYERLGRQDGQQRGILKRGRCAAFHWQFNNKKQEGICKVDTSRGRGPMRTSPPSRLSTGPAPPLPVEAISPLWQLALGNDVKYPEQGR